MINISEKPVVRRYAKASGSVVLKKETVDLIRKGEIKKGDVFTSAKIAGIQGAKEAWSRMPYCHQVPIESIDFTMNLEEEKATVSCAVVANWKTGVEMDALSCVTSALLTIWDMTKYLEKDDTGNYPSTEITDVHVDTKEKGHAPS
ncbi:MAG: cyclic pyranopterin monophosphate synthase MoaC [Candidatus Thermoplasmatota archaeon]|jgi:cyclic pyranopterin phosphate synthase|nr:cyclic pyranopterin monophosphate synthase MoaC [Candidatus Thermoplasmatota archaeon]